MPSAPKRQCPRCRALVSGRCDCTVREDNRKRGTPASKGYGYSWQKRRKEFIDAHPLCEQCLAGGIECWKANYDFHNHRINGQPMTDAQRQGILLDWMTGEPIPHPIRYMASSRTLEHMNAGVVVTERRRCMFESGDAVTHPATEVDHIVPHRGNMELFDDPENWQGLCESMHGVKTGGGE